MHRAHRQFMLCIVMSPVGQRKYWDQIARLTFSMSEFDAVPMLDAVLDSRDSLSPPKQPALG